MALLEVKRSKKAPRKYDNDFIQAVYEFIQVEKSTNKTVALKAETEEEAKRQAYAIRRFLAREDTKRKYKVTKRENIIYVYKEKET